MFEINVDGVDYLNQTQGVDLGCLENRLETITPGVLKVAVTGVCSDGSAHHNCWVYDILSAFAKESGLELEFITVNFDDSWQLAANHKVDIVATGITPLEERKVEGTTFSRSYSLVKRGIRIKTQNADKFHTMNDFVGFKLGAVKGMTSEIDLLRRAKDGVEIVTTDTWEELYDLFESDQIQGVAEGFYVFPEDDKDVNELEDNTVMIDPHDLFDGEEEGNTFVVRDESTNLLESINHFIRENGLPHSRMK